MNINVSPIFSDALTEFNRTLIQWYEHKLTSGEAQQRISSIMTIIMHGDCDAILTEEACADTDSTPTMIKLEPEQYESIKGEWYHEHFQQTCRDYTVAYMRHGKLETAIVLEVQPTKLIVSTYADGIKTINRLDCVPYSRAIFIDGMKTHDLFSFYDYNN